MKKRIREMILGSYRVIVTITGILLKNYFDDMSLDWEKGRKASAEIWYGSIATFNQTIT
jgi:hypothetical protein